MNYYPTDGKNNLLKKMRKVAKISIESFNVVSDDEPEKKEQEIASLIRIPDSFKKIVVVKGYMKPW